MSATEGQRLGQRLSSQPVSPQMIPTIGGIGRRYRLFTPILEEIPLQQFVAETARAAQAATMQLAGDVAAIDRYNAPILQTNSAAIEVLKHVSGQDLGEGREDWQEWATDLLGYAYVPQRASQEPRRSSRMSRWDTSPS